MKTKTSLEKIASELLETKDLTLQSCTPIQTLWAGCGHIARITARHASVPSSDQPATVQTYILKHVSPPSISSPPAHSKHKTTKSSNSTIVDEGHLRKLLSYQIEQRFYVHLASLIPEDIAIAICFAHSPTPEHNSNNSNDSNASTLLLTDLRTLFPTAGEETPELTSQQVHAALDWLAGFHGFWWAIAQDKENNHHDLDWSKCVLSPLQHVAEHGSSSSLDCYGSAAGFVWQRGGYSHLATRRKEYESLKANKRSEWSRKLCRPVDTTTTASSIAELVDMLLYPCRNEGPSAPYQTLIHGDVKSENLFSSLDGTRVAFYDFQYVGLGLGVSDLAKLFTVSVPLEMLVNDEERIGCAGKAGLEMGKVEEALLRRYCSVLEARTGRRYEWPLFLQHWEAALVDWLRFQASWGFWGNTEWLESRVRRILQDEEWLMWLTHSVKPG